MRVNYLETTVGLVTVLFSIAFVLFSIGATNRKLGQKFYRLYAEFANVSGIYPGTKVRIGGVDIGSVFDVTLEKNHSVLVSIGVKMGTIIPVDSCIKVSTSGLIGSKYLRIEVGGNDEILKDGDRFDFTESAMDLEDVITHFLLNRASDAK
ncbi:MAG: MlaD family protein [Rickettsiales bacterium]|jgi:phospholipid/cholesterol/gamma-HCH transport system substrate-binding protein|nr:MlaD family protein [Rickettsiales bacterium]